MGLVELRVLGTPANVMLLTTDDGQQVSTTMLRDRWDAARGKAAIAFPKQATEIQAIHPRAMRKRVASLAVDTEVALTVLQDSSLKVTPAHYHTKVSKLTAVR